MINAHFPDCPARPGAHVRVNDTFQTYFGDDPKPGDLSAAVLADYLNYNLIFCAHLLLYAEVGLASVGSQLLLRRVSREAGNPARNQLASPANDRYRTGRPESS
jgi:hypothetical protein